MAWLEAKLKITRDSMLLLQEASLLPLGLGITSVVTFYASLSELIVAGKKDVDNLSSISCIILLLLLLHHLVLYLHVF